MNYDKERLEDLLVTCPPAELGKWLEEVWRGEIEYPDDVNSWLYIYENVYHEAIRMPHLEKRKIDIDRANLAIEILDYLSRKNTSRWEGFQTQTMHIRVNALRDYGDNSNIALCDSGFVYQSFLSSVDISPEVAMHKKVECLKVLQEAEKGSPLYRENVGVLGDLRHIKIMLHPVVSLSRFIPATKNILKWVDIVDELP